MPDPIEEAKTVAYVLDTRSVYNRVGKQIHFRYSKENTFLVFLF